jgi:hypothetical protein
MSFLQPSHDFTDHSSYTSLVTIIEGLSLEEGVMHSTNGRLVEDSSM